MAKTFHSKLSSSSDLPHQNVCKVVKGVPLDRLVNAQQQELGHGKALADGGADTTIVGTGWTVTHKRQQEAHIKGFADDLCKKNIPIVTALTVMDLPDNTAVIIQACQ